MMTNSLTTMDVVLLLMMNFYQLMRLDSLPSIPANKQLLTAIYPPLLALLLLSIVFVTMQSEVLKINFYHAVKS